MKVKLNVQPDKPTVNGHIYPKEIIEREILSRELPVYLGLGTGELNDLNDLIGFATSKLNEKNEIVSEIKLLNTSEANVFKAMRPDDYEYTIKGLGEASKDKKIIDFKCNSINIIDKEG
jgi:hypothetical protein